MFSPDLKFLIKAKFLILLSQKRPFVFQTLLGKCSIAIEFYAIFVAICSDKFAEKLRYEYSRTHNFCCLIFSLEHISHCTFLSAFLISYITVWLYKLYDDVFLVSK